MLQQIVRMPQPAVVVASQIWIHSDDCLHIVDLVLHTVEVVLRVLLVLETLLQPVFALVRVPISLHTSRLGIQNTLVFHRVLF